MYTSTAFINLSNGYARAAGTNDARKAWFGACNDNAKLTPCCPNSSVNDNIFGTMPTVETVMRLGLKQKVSR